MNLAELVVRQAETRPDRCALAFGDRELGYGEYRDLAGRLAGALLERGVKRGDRVFFYSRNNPEYLVAYTACAWIGAVFAPIHHGFKERELSYVADNARAVLAFVEGELVEEYLRHAASIDQLPSDIVVIEPKGRSGVRSGIRFDDMVTEDGEIPPLALVSDNDPVLICYTSGSTSNPKPVLRSHANELWNAERYVDYWDMRPDDVALMALPLSWVFGLCTMGQALVAAGARIQILTHFNPVTAIEAIHDHKVTLFAGTNTMYVKLLDVYDRQGGDLSSLRNCYIGGEPANAAAVRRFEQLVGSRLWQAYAATEAAPVIVATPGRDEHAPADSVGRLVDGAEIRIVDDQGRPVLPGEPGEAHFRCPGSMLEYYREPELTRERVTPDGWFTTGDLVIERDGYYFVVGRKSDMIIRGGSNVAPAEVEGALTSIPGIADAVVFGVPDAEYGEQVAAAITVAEGVEISDEELIVQLGRRLAAFKVPGRLFRVLTLPEGRTGKRDRRAVRDHVLAVAVDVDSAMESERTRERTK